MPRKRLEKIIDQTEERLKLLQELGIKELVREKVDPIFKRKREALEKLRKEVQSCERCALSKTRTFIVFGEGEPNAEVMFVGEAPGAEEDLTGRPFVGAAGKLLTDIIELGMRIPRQKVFIGNVIKCRPPGNRDPKPEEIQQCRVFLERQIQIIKPKVIIALGRFSAQLLTGSDAPISHLRGKWWNYQGIPVMPTYHPAYLLYNNAGKKEVWADIKAVLQYLNKEQ